MLTPSNCGWHVRYTQNTCGPIADQDSWCNSQKGGSLARGPLEQAYDYIKGDAMRVYDALGGFATELKDLNVARDAKRILPKWML